MALQHVIQLLVVFVVCPNINCEEPKCSKFDYEEKTLEKMIRLEVSVDNTLDEIKTERHAIRSELADLRAEREGIKKKLAEFKLDMKEASKKNTDTIDNTFKRYESQIMRMSEDLTTALNNSLQDINDSQHVPQVEFRVKNIADTTPTNGQAMSFTTVDLNQGGGYDVKTGYFTAPVGGIYLLMTHICLKPSNYMFFDIVCDEVTLLSFQASAHHYNFCGTWIAIANMKIGSKAYIKSRRTINSSPFKISTNHLNQFSGILLNKGQ